MTITLSRVTSHITADAVTPTPLLDTAWITGTDRYRSSRLSLSVVCPHCYAVHHHGLDDLDDPGYRSPHCSAPEGYHLRWPTDEVADFLAAQRGRCAGITQAGSRCLRPAGLGKDGTRWLCPSHRRGALTGVALEFDYPVPA